jgi:hypothetical protein
MGGRRPARIADRALIPAPFGIVATPQQGNAPVVVKLFLQIQKKIAPGGNMR